MQALRRGQTGASIVMSDPGDLSWVYHRSNVLV